MKSSPKMVAILLLTLILSIPFTFAAQINFVYDANGNVVYDGDTFREYNSLNQLSAVYNGTDNTTLLAEYTYHPVEERVLMKKVYDAGVWEETIYYISDTFVSKKNSSGLYNETYVHLNGQQIAQNINGQKEFIHTDHLGSSSVLTNTSGGIVESTTYSPYGEIVSGGSESRYDYTGKEKDETGSYDFNARQYNSEYGLFMSPDPIIQGEYNPKTLNHYMYVWGNPYAAVDPSGKAVVYISGGAPSLNENFPPGTWNSLNNNPVDIFYGMTELNSNEMIPTSFYRTNDFYYDSRESTYESIKNFVYMTRGMYGSDEPLVLVGHSWGGALAIDLSRQLVEDGIVVDAVISIDPYSWDITLARTPDGKENHNYYASSILPPNGRTSVGNAIDYKVYAGHGTILSHKAVQDAVNKLIKELHKKKSGKEYRKISTSSGRDRYISKNAICIPCGDKVPE